MATKTTLSAADWLEIANSKAIYDLIVVAYCLREEVFDFVREATSVGDATARARDARDYANDLLIALGSSTVGPGKTLEDAEDAMAAASLLATESQSCKDGYRWDPITQTCVPI